MAFFGGRRLPVAAVVLTGVFVFIWLHIPSSTSRQPSLDRTQQGLAVNADTNLISSQCGTNVSLTASEKQEVSRCVGAFGTFRKKNSEVNRPEMERVRVDSHSYLTSESRVVEVGGYTGVDAAKLIKKYNPYYMALEPIPRYQKILEDRYKENPKFSLLKFGLGRENKTLTLNIDSDATSLFRAKKKSADTKVEVAQIREINNFFRNLDVERKPIDLISINCEGCEYELIELLVTSKYVSYLKNIQFQFHLDLPGIANQECRYCQIMTLLSRTHKPTFQYSYTWQSWRLKTG